MRWLPQPGDRAMQVTIYHNPRCSKSRQTLQLLRERGLEPRVVEYLKSPPAAAELDALLDLMGRGPREAMRRGEAAYAAAGLDDPGLDRAALVAAMVAQPILIERPIVVVERDGARQARMGRPPEAVLEIL